MPRLRDPLFAAAAVLAVLFANQTVVAGISIYCGCTLRTLQPCENFGIDNPVCQLAYVEISGEPGDMATIRRVTWFQDEKLTLPYTATNSIRTVSPFSMNPSGRLPVNLGTLRRTVEDPEGLKFIGARVTSIVEPGAPATDVELKVVFAFSATASALGGIARTAPERACPAPTATPACQFSGSSTWAPSSLTTTWASFVQRLSRQCAGSTLTITSSLAFTAVEIAPDKDLPLRLARNGVRIVASRGVTIDFAGTADPGGCGVEIRASNIVLSGFTIGNKAGMCVCGSATTGVQILNSALLGANGNIKVDRSAGVALIQNINCDGMEDPCIQNVGTINSILSSRFGNGTKSAAILNFGSITSINSNSFTAMVTSGTLECVEAAGVVLNDRSASITRITNNRFDGIIGGRAIWNDGVLGPAAPASAALAVDSNRFTNFEDGAIANGPSGRINGRIQSNVATSGLADAGAGVLNYGTIYGTIERNNFTDMDTRAGGVVANLQPGDEVPPCFGGPGSEARIASGIIANTISFFNSGDGCGAVFNGEEATIGNFDSVWAAIGTNANYVPAAPIMEGIVGNIVRNGISSDTGVGICNAGKASIIANNIVSNVTTADSGGGIFVSGSTAYIGNNSIRSAAVTDVGGGIFCSNPSFGSSPRRAVVKMLKNNVVNGASSAGEGGCIYATEGCAVEFLSGNNCSQIVDINPGLPSPGEPTGPIVFEVGAPPEQPPAILCFPSNNRLDGRNITLRPLGLRAGGACPFRVVSTASVKNGIF